MQAVPRFFLGVDGGATRCRARLRDAAGALVAAVEGKAANIYVDFDSAIGAVGAQVEAACAKAGLARPIARASRLVSASPGFPATKTPNGSRRASTG